MTTNRITRVWAEPVALGLGAGGRPVYVPGLWWLGWRSLADGLVRVCVDGEPVACSDLPGQRELLLACDGRRSAVVEVLLMPDESSALADMGIVTRLTWHQDNNLPDDTVVRIYCDDEITALYEEPLWRGPWQRWGFGAGGFGEQDFGYDGAGAPGLDSGAFGVGSFGFDCLARVMAVTAEPGLNRYRIRHEAPDGTVHQESECTALADPLPEPAGLAWGSYDAVNDRLTLQINA